MSMLQWRKSLSWNIHQMTALGFWDVCWKLTDVSEVIIFSVTSAISSELSSFLHPGRQWLFLLYGDQTVLSKFSQTRLNHSVMSLVSATLIRRQIDCADRVFADMTYWFGFSVSRSCTKCATVNLGMPLGCHGMRSAMSDPLQMTS